MPSGLTGSTYNRTLYLEVGSATTIDVVNLYSPGSQVTFNSSLPGWFVNNTIGGYSNTWVVTAPVDGTFTYSVQVFNGTQFVTATLNLLVQDFFENIDNCCDKKNIVWLNRQGGFGNFMFTQRRDYSVDLDKPSTFISDDVIKYSERGRVYDSITVYCTGISNNQIDYIDTLRYAIQAWEYDEDSKVFTPILIESGNFAKRNTKIRMNRTTLTYRYAKSLNVQMQ